MPGEIDRVVVAIAGPFEAMVETVRHFTDGSRAV
jgi:hypothetical protein